MLQVVLLKHMRKIYREEAVICMYQYRREKVFSTKFQAGLQSIDCHPGAVIPALVMIAAVRCEGIREQKIHTCRVSDALPVDSVPVEKLGKIIIICPNSRLLHLTDEFGSLKIGTGVRLIVAKALALGTT